MNNQTLLFKLENRINKIGSLDYGNIEPSQKAEAVNKAQDNWVGRQLEGINQTKTGAEGSIRRIDDLQYILTTVSPVFTDQGKYWQSSTFPADYLEWCRVDANAINPCDKCCPRPLVIFMGNEADVSIYLADVYRQPSYSWATTFATMIGSSFRIYTNDEFDIDTPLVTYYRNPRRIIFINSTDPYTGAISSVDVTCEFPDRITELIIDEAAAILSGDLENWTQKQSLQSSVEHNT